MFYKLSALALVGATFALPGAPAQYPDTTTSTTVEHAPVYGAHTSSSSSSEAHPPAYGTSSSTSSIPQYPTQYGSSSSSSTTKSVPVYGHPSSTTEPVKYSSTTEPAKYTSSTAKCPAPGSYDSQHRYSCNPAHAYPDGQTCELVDGCYFLQHGKTSSSKIPHYYPTTSEAPHYTTKVVTSLTTYCPEPTTFTHGPSTYTVTKATTLTLPCPYGCTITKSQPPIYHPTGSVSTPKSYPPHETTVIKTTSTITAYKPTSVPVYSTKGTTYYSTSLTASYSVSTWEITKTVEKPKPTTAAPKPSCPVCPVQNCAPPVTVTTTVYTSMQPPPTYVAPPPHETSSQAPPPSSYVPPQPTKETKTTEVKTSVKTTETHPVPTPSCPAPGSTDNKGRYSCNPAHQYPAGQTCKLVDGCYYLEYPKTTTEIHPTVYKPTTTAVSYPTPACPAPGSTDNKGRYSCNPAHQYPAGQTCKLVDGCYYLEYPKTTTEVHPTVYKPTTTAVSYPTPACPAPGTTDKNGQYSCNPAHAYPEGQTCKLVDGCYYLQYPKTTASVYKPSTTESKPVSYPTPACPAPGSTDNKGRYSCNPAHAYPEGQTCELVDGCYFLEHPKPSTYGPSSSSTTKSIETYPAHPTTYSSPPKYETTTTSIVTPPAYTKPSSSSPPKYETTTTSVEHPPQYTVSSTSSVPVYEQPTTTPVVYSSTTPAAYHSTIESATTPAAYPTPKGY